MISIKVLSSGSRGNAYVITSNHARILLECGIPLSKIIKRTNHNMSFDGVLVSHKHKDHAFCVKELIKKGYQLYIGEEIKRDFKLKGFNVHTIKNEQSFKIGDLNIFPFTLNHDCECYGFAISDGEDKLLFATDTTNIKYIFNDISILMLEANYGIEKLKGNIYTNLDAKNRFLRVLKTHMSIETVVNYLKYVDLNKLKLLMLLHLSADNADEDLFKKMVSPYVQNVVIAKNGVVWDERK